MGEVAGFDRRWVPLNGGGEFLLSSVSVGPKLSKFRGTWWRGGISFHPNLIIALWFLNTVTLNQDFKDPSVWLSFIRFFYFSMLYYCKWVQLGRVNRIWLDHGVGADSSGQPQTRGRKSSAYPSLGANPPIKCHENFGWVGLPVQLEASQPILSPHNGGDRELENSDGTRGSKWTSKWFSVDSS